MPQDQRFVLCAPSGTGKTSAVQRLLRSYPDLRKVTSFTTRAPRPGESRSDYRFVRPSEFNRLLKKGRFLEATHAYGARYASGRLEGEGRVIMERTFSGWMAVKRVYRDAAGIFLMPPSQEELERRLTGRNSEAPEQRQERLGKARQECMYWSRCDYVVVAEDHRRTHQSLCEILSGRGREHRVSTQRTRARVEQLLEEKWDIPRASEAPASAPRAALSMSP